MKNKIRGILSNYRITIVLLILWTLTGIADEIVRDFLYTEKETNLFWSGVEMLQDYELLSGLWRFFFLAALGCWLAETLFENNLKRKLMVMLPGTCLSGVFAFLMSSNITGEDSIRITEWIAGYVIIMLALILFFSYRKTKLTFSEFVGGVFTNEMVVAFLSTLIFIGGVLFFATLEALFEGDFEYGYLFTTYLFCFCVLAGCVWALNDAEKEMHPAIIFSLWYILPVIAMGIIAAGYLYVLKMLFLREVPSNEVFTTMTVLFAVCFPVWIMSNTFQKEGIYHRFLSAFPWLFVPLLGLQVYSLGIRIGEYGLTEQRYLGVMLILFEAAAIVTCKFKSDHTERLLFVVIVLTVVSVYVPFINMTSLSRLNPNYGDTASAVGTTESDTPEKKWGTIHGCQMVGELDAAGFSSMNMLNEAGDYETYEYDNTTCLEVDFSNFRFVKRQTGETIEVDLSGLYEDAVNYMRENPNPSKDKQTAYLKKNNRFELADGSQLYINHFEVSWIIVTEDGKEEWKVRDTNIGGILLEK